MPEPTRPPHRANIQIPVAGDLAPAGLPAKDAFKFYPRPELLGCRTYGLRLPLHAVPDFWGFDVPMLERFFVPLLPNGLTYIYSISAIEIRRRQVQCCMNLQAI